MLVYPAQYESVALRGVFRVQSRPLRPDDETRLFDRYRRLPPLGLYRRLSAIPRPDPIYAGYLADVAHVSRRDRADRLKDTRSYV